jgi:hypothetical protein
MGWKSYELDRVAQKLVLDARKRDETKSKKEKSLNQAHKMRMAVSFGLERFWGEHLRLKEKERNKSLFWEETWQAFATIMSQTGVNIPKDKISDIHTIEAMSKKLWDLDLETQRVSLAVLTQLCDAIIWWTQRHKGGSDDGAG